MADKRRRLEYKKSDDSWIDYWERRERSWARMASEVTVIKPDQTREDVAEEIKEKEERHKKKIEGYRNRSRRRVR